MDNRLKFLYHLGLLIDGVTQEGRVEQTDGRVCPSSEAEE
jgi:hypothetical protein